MQSDKLNQIWLDFRSAFISALDAVDTSKLKDAWTHVRKRTDFYEKILMPHVAHQLNRKLQIERLRCDYTFLDDNYIPLIAVESENAHPTAWREVESLCSLAAPLKVLILSCEWQATEKQKFLPSWTEIIRKHHEVVSVESLYVIVVGEWRNADSCLIEYSFTVLDTIGQVLEESVHQIAHR